jgi:phosphatidylglycerophosphate synthase
MSHDTWIHGLVRGGVRRLAGTRVTPNHLTTVRLVTGLAAIALVAQPGYAPAAAGAIVYLVSMLFDRADGELARLTGQSSRFGHIYDLAADATCTVGLFIGIGFGARYGPLGGWAVPLGVLAGISVALIFPVAEKIRAVTGDFAFHSVARFDPDDALAIVPLAVLLNARSAILVAAAVGATAFLVFALVRLWRTLRSRTGSTR